MERMINDRLVWYLEKNKLLSSVQCGFPKRRSTTDYLVRLETFVRVAFVQRQNYGNMPLPYSLILKKLMTLHGTVEL